MYGNLCEHFERQWGVFNSVGNVRGKCNFFFVTISTMPTCTACWDVYLSNLIWSDWNGMEGCFVS